LTFASAQLRGQRAQHAPLADGQLRRAGDMAAAERLLNPVAGRARSVLAEWPS